MTRFESLTLHLSFLLVSVTGLIYAWMLYLLEPVDEFAVVNHRWQPLMQHAHVWVAPLVVFAIGLVWRHHVWNHFRSGVRKRRRSGLILMLNVVPMVASGYLLQTSVGTTWRNVWMWVHLASSALFLAGFLAHQLRWLLQRFRPSRAVSAVTSLLASGDQAHKPGR